MGYRKIVEKPKENGHFLEFHFRVPAKLGQDFKDEATKEDRSEVSLFRKMLGERYADK